jgi:hypothetical protein
MKSQQAPYLRLELRFHEASDARLYTHLAAMPPRLRAEFLRHLARLGWLVHTGQVVPKNLPASETPDNVKNQQRSTSDALDQELLAALE